MSLIQVFNNVASSLSECNSFQSVRKRTREELASKFLESSKDVQDTFLDTLYKWATNRMHSTKPSDKVIALASFAYILDIVEDQTHYQNLATQLERILPVENTTVIEGITFILERIARRSETPILPSLLERMTSRLYSTSALSSVYIFKNVVFTNNVLYERFGGLINQVVIGALRHENQEVRDCGVSLFLGKLKRDPSPDDCGNAMIDDCIQAADNVLPSYMYDGFIHMIAQIMGTRKFCLNSKAQSFFKLVLNLLRPDNIVTITKRIFEVQQLHPFISQLRTKLLSIICDTCQISEDVSNILSKFIEIDNEIGPCITEYAKKITDDKAFFRLAPSLAKYCQEMGNYIYERISKSSITNESILAAAALAKYQQQFSFKISQLFADIINEKFNEDLQKTMDIIISVPLTHTIKWSEIAAEMIKIFASCDENTKILIIKAFYKSLKNIEDRSSLFIQFLFIVSSDPMAKIRKNALELIPDDFIVLFNDQAAFSILESFYYNEENSVSITTLNVIGKIKEKFPLIAFRFFSSRISTAIPHYNSVSSLSSRREQMEIMPTLIRLAGDAIDPFISSYIDSFLEILQTDFVSPANLYEANLRRDDRNDDRIIKKNILFCINELASKISIFLDKMPSIIKAVTHLLFASTHRSIHIEVAKTLIILFRSYDLQHNPNIDVIRMHRDIFYFLSSCYDTGVITEFLRLFGTIGPLDPYLFHSPEDQVQPDSYDCFLICDVSKRKTCYIHFVMRYVLDQLQQHSNMYEPSVLIIAIVYIFQSDPTNSLPFLSQIVAVFSNILNEKIFNPPDAIFHFLRSIILLVDVSILPYAGTIMEMVIPFVEKANLPAIKTLSSLVFALKGNYDFGDVFPNLCAILRTTKITMECDTYIMLTITLMTIYCDSNPNLFFELAKERIMKGNTHSLVFLTWVISSGKFPALLIPSLKLALAVKTQPQLMQNSKQLIAIVNQKNPNLCKAIHVDVEEVEIGDFQPRSDIVPNKIRPASQKRGIETVLNHVPASEYSPLWLLQLTQDLVLCSSSAAIRACRPLLNGASKFHIKLFPLALVSVWEEVSDEDREKLSECFVQIVNDSGTNIQVLSTIVDSAEALDRAGFKMFKDPMLAGKTAEKCNSWFQAIRFFTEYSSQCEEPLKHLLKIEAQLKRVSSANGLLHVISDEQTDAGLFESLNMWDKALEIYEKHMDKEIAIPGRVKCLMMKEDYDKVLKEADNFDSFTKETKNKVASYFLIASMHSGLDYSKYVQFLIRDDPNICSYRAIAAIKENDMQQGEEFIDRAMNALNSQFTLFTSYESALPTINFVTLLEDLRNVINVSKGEDTASHVIDIWSHNSDSIKRDSIQLRSSMIARELLQCTDEQRRDMNVEFLNDLRRLKEWPHFDNLFRTAFKGKKDPVVSLIRAIVRYERGITNNTEELNKIVKKMQNSDNDDVYCDAVCAVASHSKITEYVMYLLGDVLKRKPDMGKAWEIWTYANLNLTQRPENVAEFYANNAMIGFWRLVELNGTAMHYLCQLCSLFFNYGISLANFEESAEKFRNLSPEGVLLIIPQLVVQLEHPVEAVRSVVYDIIKNFAKDHFQAVALPLNLQRQNKSSDFIDSLFMEHINISGDILVFAKLMTSLAITPAEEVPMLCERLLELGDSLPVPPESLDIITRIYNIINFQKYGAPFREWFESKTARLFSEKAQKVLHPTPKTFNSDRVFLLNAAQALAPFLNRGIEAIDTIDINDIGLSTRTDKLSVSMPGTYKTGSPLITIDHINHILKMIPSAKRPRKMRMVGSDGKVYKYLLKGKEDLRLDQHIMQFFSLVNSILSINKLSEGYHIRIMQYHIIPLTTSSGLISWAAGGETLSSLITWRRKISGRPVDAEKKVFLEMSDKGRDGTLNYCKLQKLELFRKLCSAVPDTEIDEALWLKSTGSQQWLMQTTNFSRSTALMSMVGYVIGLGDRHPLNILFMKRNGNIVHIDLSDCFEKASFRKFVREIVPFRLTRMIQRALGAAGTQGIFRQTAEDVLSVMRKNQQTLLAFLDIFVQEPVIDALWYEESCGNKNCLKQAISIVADKLSGKDCGDNISVPEQVDLLIEKATSETNLSQMYYGWAPYW